MKKPTYLIFAIILFALSANVLAQAVTFESAKANYDAKEYKKAAEDFKRLSKSDKTNANVWNYLGLSYRAIDEGKKSRDAFKKAVKLAPKDNAIRFNYAVILSETGSSKALDEIDIILRSDPDQIGALFLRGATNVRLKKFGEAKKDAQRLIALDPKAAGGYLLSSEILEHEMNESIIRKRSTALDEIDFLKRSIEMLEAGAAKCGDCSSREAFEYQLSIRRMLYDRVQKNDYAMKIRQVGLPDKEEEAEKPGDKRFKVLSKPRAYYTDAARDNNVSGSINILVLFGASGQIESTILANSLGYGLDENALNAAQQIRFEPQIKNGKAVSSIKEVEYTFTIF